MVFNRFTWDNYCQTDRGRAMIKGFSDIRSASDQNIIEQVSRFNPEVFRVIRPEAFLDGLGFFEWIYKDYFDDSKAETFQQAYDLYSGLGEKEVLEEDGKVAVPAGDYSFLLQGNIALSYALSFAFPDFFIPNLYCFNFGEFVRLCDNFEEISLPVIPKKSDLRARYLYYGDMCRVLYEFRIKQGLSRAELCAFIYDFAPASISGSKEVKELPKPSSIWCIGGSQKDPEGLWQCDEETHRGDIVIYYQKAPKSAITRILLADADGQVDPFFRFYSRTCLCEPKEIPDITLQELRADEYFANHPLIKKNFQGVNGWPMKFTDYQRILDILRSRGFDVSQLPMMPVAEFHPDHRISVEKDVENYLLIPYLAECGITDKDYIRQMPLHMGRGDVKYPDYAVFVNTEEGYETAKILIEAKLEIRNNRDREEAFKQARSYALRLESEYIILCDRNAAWIYQGADRVNYERFSWAELREPANFARMRLLFSKYKKEVIQ